MNTVITLLTGQWGGPQNETNNSAEESHDKEKPNRAILISISGSPKLHYFLTDYIGRVITSLNCNMYCPFCYFVSYRTFSELFLRKMMHIVSV